MEVVNSEYRIKTVLGRLEAIIDSENTRIGDDPTFDLKVSNAHKSRCLYELTMLFRDSDTQELVAKHLESMHSLRAKLRTNITRVEAHLRAVRAVADILKNAAHNAEDDGTYSQEQFLQYNAR